MGGIVSGGVNNLLRGAHHCYCRPSPAAVVFVFIVNGGGGAMVVDVIFATEG